jgi:hypothetical protein
VTIVLGRQRITLGWAIAIGAIIEGGCGGVTRIGTTNEGRGGSVSDASAGGSENVTAGGRSNSDTGGSAGASCRGAACGSGGRVAGAGGRPGGAFGTGGRSTGGASTGGTATGGRTFDAGSDPGRNRVPPSEACDRLSTIQCAAEIFCCPAAPTLELCRQAKAGACNLGGYFDDLAGDPLVGYDIDRAEAAFSEFEKRASACDPTIVSWSISDPGFRGVARGTLPPGANCAPASPNDAGSVGKYIAFLGSCADPEKMGCFGSPEEQTWTCTPRSTLGGRCLTELNCVDGLHCEYGLPEGRCVERKANGIPCGSMLECQSLHCDVSGRCAAPTVADIYCLPY